MRIVCISDTHGYRLDRFNIPDGDILIHAGDGVGYYENGANAMDNQLSELPHQYKIYVPGNHDGYFKGAKKLKNAEVLIDRAIEIEGIKIYGSPYTPKFQDWHFMLPRSSDALKKKWEEIPSGIDILITHGPPFGILDWTVEGNSAGCELLREEILNRVKPKYHICGHIHESAGILEKENTVFINCSMVNRRLFPVGEAAVFDL
jgi:Icc-related predicted phosphoesterase